MAGDWTRRELTALLAAGIALGPAAASAQPEETPEAADSPPTEVALARASSLQVTAPVLINGQGPYQFIIDTGASASCLSARVAGALQLPAGPAVRLNTLVGVRSRSSVILDRLQIGDRVRRRVRAPVLSFTGFEADGVLGIDWLKGQRLVLGFSDSKMEITRSKADRSQEGQVVVPARRRMGQLTIVDADLSGERISAILDSGSEVSLANSSLRSLVRQRDPSSAKGDPVAMISIAGENFSGDGGFLPFLRLGGLQLGNVPVVYSDSHVFKLWDLEDSPAILIGMDLLRQFETVHLDFGRSAVRFDFTDKQKAANRA
ncbi:MAG: retroviral-like aspartic protease family protein [Phenylobacterium sp.]